MSQKSVPDTSLSPNSLFTAGSLTYTPSSTPSEPQSKASPVTGDIHLRHDILPSGNMADLPAGGNDVGSEKQEPTELVPAQTEHKVDSDVKNPNSKCKCCNKQHTKKSKSTRKSTTGKSPYDSGLGSDSESEDESSTSSSSDSPLEDEKEKRKKMKKQAKKLAKQKKASKDKKSRRRKKVESTSEEESSDSEASESESEVPKRKRKSKTVEKKRRKAKKPQSEDEDTVSTSDESEAETKTSKRKKKSGKKGKKTHKEVKEDKTAASDDSETSDNYTDQMQELKLKKKLRDKEKNKSSKSKRTSGKKSSGSSLYKRVDHIWDNSENQYKLKESAEHDDKEFSEYGFLVRRRFDWEGKYIATVVDIKSKQLRNALAVVMKECKNVSLEVEEPTVVPENFFLYLEALRTYYRKTLKAKVKSAKKRKEIKELQMQRKLVKALVGYIDEDFADTKKNLYPLLEAGNITFELLWALFRPADLAVTSTYGSWDEPRCYKVEYCNKFKSMQRGEYYCVEGKYLEYDGKGFGFGDFEMDVDEFKGPRKINSLPTYPLRYHANAEDIRKQMIARGRHFTQLEGMNYRFHKGMAFLKKKKQVLKININGRIMVDPAIFRRINPNYPIANVKPKEAEELFDLEHVDNDDDDGCCCDGSDDAEDALTAEKPLDNKIDGDEPKYKYKWVENEEGDHEMTRVEVNADGLPVRRQKLDHKEEQLTKKHEWTEEELLLTSPVVLGFAFSEKLWLEFTISGIRDIEWDAHAFDSLVLPADKKSVVKALVESHKFNAARTIDDVVQGKGRGLVSVLHGPPGTGKTLTAEGISELLKCPLYMVSAGELGTEPAKLEHNLQEILDIAHSWGAILLLDEADVFLEKRTIHDIHRNALVSIFLRLLEYFQGILFLTTNRVDTFDDAFQSRIHLPLQYAELKSNARKQVWKQFIAMVRQKDADEVAEFTDDHFEVLSRKTMNGRQIKNVVRTAQALALHEKSKLDLTMIRRVLDVTEDFDRDLKGGTGYLDAMRSYT